MEVSAVHPITENNSPVSYIQSIIKNNGPELHDHKTLDRAMQQLADGIKSGLYEKADLAVLNGFLDDDFLKCSLHGHSYSKPFGYAGDFLIIDKMYTRHCTANPKYMRWDSYYQLQATADAIRNRKEYFKGLMEDKVSKARRPVKLLDVASGPARDLSELYQIVDLDSVVTTCVEYDQRAISYAEALNISFLEQITFINKNIFRFVPTERFDVVWSAGLFDYFDNKVFVRMLSHFLKWTEEGGEVIVGNFSLDNPARGYMEVFLEWNLHHRTAEELRNLAIDAGAKPENVWVGQEEEGINLFLHIKK